MSKTVKINKQDVPVEDVLQIRTVLIGDVLVKEFKYRLFEPVYHEVVELMENNKGYKVELAVRKAVYKKWKK